MTSFTDSQFEKLSACIHCGMCLPTCPTYRVTGSEAESPRGRLFLMKAFAHGKLDSPQQLSDHLDPCLGCLACTTACPSGVDYAGLLLENRKQLLSTQPWWKRSFRRFMIKHVLPHAFILLVLRQMTRLYQRLGIQAFIQKSGLPAKMGSFGQLAWFPTPLSPTKPMSYGQRFGKNQQGKVVLFTGCVMNAMYAHVHQATIKVLVANGYEVVIPEQTCCGALAHHAGEHDIAQALADKNVQLIIREKPDYIVVNAAGCGSTLKEYGDILEKRLDAEVFAKKVLDVMELLVKRPLVPVSHPVSMRATYHAACHLHHAQGVQQEPYDVLAQVPGLELIPLTEADMCCGSAGVYNLAHPDMSEAILAEKLNHLRQTHADVVLTANPGCALQLQAGLDRSQTTMKVMHPVEVLAQAYNVTL